MYGLPKDININKIVSMNQAISHTNHLWPRNFTMLQLCFMGNPPCCFTDYFDQSYQSQLEHSIGTEVGSGFALQKGDGFTRIIKHMPQTDFVLTL